MPLTGYFPSSDVCTLSCLKVYGLNWQLNTSDGDVLWEKRKNLVIFKQTNQNSSLPVEGVGNACKASHWRWG